jgi:hypothetical protein
MAAILFTSLSLRKTSSFAKMWIVSLYTTPVSVLIVYTLSKILALRSRHVHPTAAVTFDNHRLIMILHNPEDYCTFTQYTVGGFETAGNSCVVSSSTRFSVF